MAQASIDTLKDKQQALTPRQQQKQQVKQLLAQNHAELSKMMPTHMNADRLLKVAQTAVTTSPGLLECYAPTLLGACITLSQLGLEPNTPLGHAYLVPFNNRKQDRKDVQVIIGYKGLIDLARRSGQIVSIAAHAVREGDTFEFEYGLEEKLRHIPARVRGPIVYFYAVAHLKGGGHAFEVMTVEEVEQIRDTGQGKYNQVWKDHFEQMGRKTVVRRLCKFLPLSIEMATAIEMDGKAEAGESQGLEGVLDGEYHVESVDAGGELEAQSQAE